jgi:hypothetical protein
MEQENNTSKKIKLNSLLGWLIIIISLAAIYLILILWCSFQPWWLILLVLINYLLLLIINYLNKLRYKLSWLFSFLLATLPVLVLVFVEAWTWWMWVLVIGFYLLTLAIYFIGLLLENYWRMAIPLSLFLILLIIFINV